jgi:hypothetical protein
MAGCCERDTKEVFKPKDMPVVAINRSIDNCAGGRLNELLTCQACDKRNPRNNPNCGAKARKC